MCSAARSPEGPAPAPARQGAQLERALGPVRFARLLAELLLATQALAAALAWAGAAAAPGALGAAYAHSCHIGFSGVLFALKVVLAARTPGWRTIAGLRLPTKARARGAGRAFPRSVSAYRAESLAGDRAGAPVSWLLTSPLAACLCLPVAARKQDVPSRAVWPWPELAYKRDALPSAWRPVADAPDLTLYYSNLILLREQYVSWAELAYVQLLAPRASLLCHLAGVLAGLLHVGVTGARARWPRPVRGVFGGRARLAAPRCAPAPASAAAAAANARPALCKGRAARAGARAARRVGRAGRASGMMRARPRAANSRPAARKGRARASGARCSPRRPRRPRRGECVTGKQPRALAAVCSRRDGTCGQGRNAFVDPTLCFVCASASFYATGGRRPPRDPGQGPAELGHLLGGATPGGLGRARRRLVLQDIDRVPAEPVAACCSAFRPARAPLDCRAQESTCPPDALPGSRRPAGRNGGPGAWARPSRGARPACRCAACGCRRRRAARRRAARRRMGLGRARACRRRQQTAPALALGTPGTGPRRAQRRSASALVRRACAARLMWRSARAHWCFVELIWAPRCQGCQCTASDGRVLTG